MTIGDEPPDLFKPFFSFTLANSVQDMHVYLDLVSFDSVACTFLTRVCDQCECGALNDTLCRRHGVFVECFAYVSPY